MRDDDRLGAPRWDFTSSDLLNLDGLAYKDVALPLELQEFRALDVMYTDGDACRREYEYTRATQQNMTILLKADDERRRLLLLLAAYIFLLWAIMTAGR